MGVRRCTPAGEVLFEGDAERIEQALIGLANNAVQHTNDGDQIGFGIALQHRGAQPWVNLWVRDSGPGVDPRIIDRLFERRFRGEASAAGRADGMGIGLSIVAAIAGAHRGDVRVANRADGSGAIFTIAIPAISFQGIGGPHPDTESESP